MAVWNAIGGGPEQGFVGAELVHCFALKWRISLLLLRATHCLLLEIVMLGRRGALRCIMVLDCTLRVKSLCICACAFRKHARLLGVSRLMGLSLLIQINRVHILCHAMGGGGRSLACRMSLLLWLRRPLKVKWICDACRTSLIGSSGGLGPIVVLLLPSSHRIDRRRVNLLMWRVP